MNAELRQLPGVSAFGCHADNPAQLEMSAVKAYSGVSWPSIQCLHCIMLCSFLP